MTHYLYLITRDDKERYIGVSNNPLRRKWEHQNGYGSSNLKNREFKLDILLEGTEEFIYSKEPEYIIKFNCSLNKSPGGNHIAPCIGELNGKALLTERDVLFIRYSYSDKLYDQNDLATIYQVDRRTISSIICGTTWKHVGGPIKTGIKRVSIKQKNKIKEMFKEGMSIKEISKHLNIKYHTVYSHVKGVYK